MIDAGLAADIDIREFAMKAVAAAHLGVSALRYVEHACDVLRCCEKSVPSNGTTSATGIPTRAKDCAIVITASARANAQ